MPTTSSSAASPAAPSSPRDNTRPRTRRIASRSGTSSATIRLAVIGTVEYFGGVDELGFAEGGGETEDDVVGDRDPCDPHADDRTHVRVLGKGLR